MNEWIHDFIHSDLFVLIAFMSIIYMGHCLERATFCVKRVIDKLIEKHEELLEQLKQMDKNQSYRSSQIKEKIDNIDSNIEDNQKRASKYLSS
ncbi:MAG: hypothetical protein HY094_05325 [Candidatus Melainabacteria bacterium]|nr:hypothetical protein [Candidatus Melainabacteria bacterium]